MVERAAWALAVHGGASAIAPEDADAKRDGCHAALLAGQEVLARGGSAVEAVETAVRVFEADKTFNAGYGSALDAAGEVTCDAAIMDGATLDIGAVASISGSRFPVSVASSLLREETVLLAGTGAERWAAEHGAEMCDPSELITDKQRDAASDTVGAVALDRQGNVAVAASTGGLSGSVVGRVGDAPLPGCGFYADNGLGAVAVSGQGERIARVALASVAMRSLESLDANEAAEVTLSRIDRVGGNAGIILIDAAGRFGWAHNSPDFAVAFVDNTTPARYYSRKTKDDA